MEDEFVRIPIQEEINSGKVYVSDIYEDYEGNIWIGTSQKGMFLIPANTNYLHSQEWYNKSASEIDTRLSVKTTSIDT